MWPANTVLAPRSGQRATRSSVERLLHRLLLACQEPLPGSASTGRAYASGRSPLGFDWHAPIFELTCTLKDPCVMPRPIRMPHPAPDSEPADPFRWRRHPALRRMAEEPGMPEGERLARLAAVRGVLAARDGDVDTAARFFTEAAREPAIRFQVVPGFWGCPRGGMNAAVAAYEAAGRIRDAAALAATIRTRFRPRVLPGSGRAIPTSGPPDIATPGDPVAGTGD